MIFYSVVQITYGAVEGDKVEGETPQWPQHVSDHHTKEAALAEAKRLRNLHDGLYGFKVVEKPVCQICGVNPATGRMFVAEAQEEQVICTKCAGGAKQCSYCWYFADATITYNGHTYCVGCYRDVFGGGGDNLWHDFGD